MSIIPKRPWEIEERQANELSLEFKLIVDKELETYAVCSSIEEFNKLLSYSLLKDLPPRSFDIEINFSEVMQEIEIPLEFPIRINSVILGNASSVQYSKNNGASWTTGFPVTINSPLTRWRVPNFGLIGKGAIKIKAVRL